MDWKEALSAARNNFDKASDTKETTEINIENDSKQKGSLTVIVDKKGRNGKTATIIEGFTIPIEEVEQLARSLKQKLGVGGSVRDGEILIQGNYKDKVAKFLTNLNFKVK